MAFFLASCSVSGSMRGGAGGNWALELAPWGAPHNPPIGAVVAEETCAISVNCAGGWAAAGFGWSPIVGDVAALSIASALRFFGSQTSHAANASARNNGRRPDHSGVSTNHLANASHLLLTMM